MVCSYFAFITLTVVRRMTNECAAVHSLACLYTFSLIKTFNYKNQCFLGTINFVHLEFVAHAVFPVIILRQKYVCNSSFSRTQRLENRVVIVFEHKRGVVKYSFRLSAITLKTLFELNLFYRENPFSISSLLLFILFF